MASERLNCWHCGAELKGIPLPIGRQEECPHCSSSLHVCRLCDFFDTSASHMCHEPMADEVTDKEHSNFCDYFRPRSGLSASADEAAASSRARLEALFGGTTEASTAKRKAGRKPTAAGSDSASEGAEAARRKLAKVFKEDPK